MKDSWRQRYLELPRSIWLLTLAELLLGMQHPAQLFVFNIHLKTLGYSDAAVGSTVAWRYLAVFALALPLGLLIRGRRLKPILLIGSIGMPITGWLMLDAAIAGDRVLLNVLFALWGVSVLCGQVVSAPLVMRVCTRDNRTEGLALTQVTWPVALTSCGLFLHLMNKIGSIDVAGAVHHFDDPTMFRTLILMSCLAFPVVLAIKEDAPEPLPPKKPTETRVGDWLLIAKAATPTLIIAIGAGLTIPFMSLFFNKVFGLESFEFGRLGAATGVLIMFGSLLNPWIRRRFGYGIAIVGTQSLAICFLIALAMTDVFHDEQGMLFWACLFYLIRQPLMNMAGPVNTEMTMSYVGPRNREVMVALIAGMWSGTWFISARLFSQLRALEWDYWKIFLTTAGIYIIGVIGSALLICSWRRRRDAGLIEEDTATLQ